MKELLMKKYYKCENFVKLYSPELLAGMGVTSIVAGFAFACTGTMKVMDVLEEHKDMMDKIKEAEALNLETYSEKDVQADKTLVTVQTGASIAKTYLPAVVMTSLGVGCLLGSNQILRTRNIGLSAAYATLDKSFKEYRKRVSDRFGEEVEFQIRHDMKAEEVTTTRLDADGNEITETKVVMKANPNAYSDYARFFDEANDNWKPNPEYNLMFVKSQQQYANDLLISRGRLFLNEVYEMLGMEKTKAGQVVGWVYNGDGDNFVDFGIFNGESERARAFVNGYETNILLDFNVDGNVWETM